MVGGAAEGFAQHLVDIQHAHLRPGHARDVEGWQLHPAAVGDLDLDLPIGQLARPQHPAEPVAGLGAGLVADQRRHDPVLGGKLGARDDLLAQPLPGHVHRDLDQVADDLLDVATDIADFGELGRLDLEERRLRQISQTSRDLRLADAGRADHEDVFRQHLLAHAVVELLATPAVAQRDRDRPLGVILADDVAVQLGNDFARGKAGHRLSTRMLRLVKTQMSAAISSDRLAIAAASMSSRSIIARAAARA